MAARNPEGEARWVICPVCGHEVDATNPVGGSFEYQGQTYSFCIPKEREAFARQSEPILEVAARRRGKSLGRHPYHEH